MVYLGEHYLRPFLTSHPMFRSRLLPLGAIILCLFGVFLTAYVFRPATDAPTRNASTDLIDEVSELYQKQAREIDATQGDPAAYEEITGRYRELVKEVYERHGKAPPPPPVKRSGRN